MIQRFLPAGAVVALALCVVGCEGPSIFPMSRGGVAIESAELNSDARIAGDFDIAVYGTDGPDSVSVILIAGTEDAPQQMVHIRMYWRPRGGLTPLDASATNAMIRYAVFGDGTVTLYGGGGMLRPGSKIGGQTFKASLVGASLRVMDSDDTEGAPVGQVALADGSFAAVRDDVRAGELVRKMQIALNKQLGYPRFVEEQEPGQPPVVAR